MSKKESFESRWGFLALVLLGAGAWWAFSRGFLSFPLHLEDRLGARVAEALLSSGISDRDVVSTVREERREGQRTWVQTTRVITLPAGVTATATASRLRHLARALRLEIEVREGAPGASWAVEISRKRKILEKILLRSRETKRGEGRPSGHRVAIVIDDVSGSSELLPRYFELGIPLTFAILPQGSVSRRISEALSGTPHEQILHLPLEPHGFKDGADARTLLVAMPSPQKEELLRQHLSDVPGARGVSNHTGSAFTEDRGSMRTVLSHLKGKGLFFFDSHTSGRTVAYPLAKEMRIPTALNRVFLDNKDEPGAIADQLRTLLNLSRTRPRTAAIGHYRRKHLAAVLKDFVPDFEKNGIEFVTLSRVLEASGEPSRTPAEPPLASAAKR